MEQVLLIGMILLTVAVLFNYVLTFALIRRQNAGMVVRKPRGTLLKIGEPAPDFTAETLSGETVTRASYAGRATAFLFFKSDCGP